MTNDERSPKQECRAGWTVRIFGSRTCFVIFILIGAAGLLLAAYTNRRVAQAKAYELQAQAEIRALQGQAYQDVPRVRYNRPATLVRIEYTITDLGTLGGKNSHVAGINAHGQVVGASDTGAGGASQGWYAHAFLYSDGKMRDLDTFGGSHSEAIAINDARDVIGKTERDGGPQDGGFTHNFLYSGGKMQILKPLEQDVSMAGINNAGQMTGYYFDREASESRAILYSDGNLHDLGKLDGKDSLGQAINDRGEVVGMASTKEGYNHAFLYSGGKMRDLGTLGGWESYAEAINNKGQVVGGADPAGSSEKEFTYLSMGATQIRSASMRLHAFLYFDGKMQDLGPLSETHDPSQEYCSHAYGINASGQVVGSMSVGGFYNGPSCAFLYSDGKMIDLNTRVDLAHSGFKFLFSARAINDAGQIVGEGVTNAPFTTHAFLLTPINTKKK